MAYNDPDPGTLKRKRRRTAHDATLSARLQLVDGRSGDLAEVSQDLIRDLQLDEGQGPSDHLYLAVKQWTPAVPPATLTPKWIILPCRPMTKEPLNSHSLVKVAARSKAFNILSEALQLGTFPRSRTSAPTLEIRVTHALPVVLETIYVTVDSTSEQQPPSRRGMLGGRKPSLRPLGANGGSPLDRLDEDQESIDEVKKLVRSALKKFAFIYTNDEILLPSKKNKASTTPQTASVTACEPVAQGLLAETTKIVVITSSSKLSQPRKPTIPAEALADLEEDASNEAFYTAIEPDEDESNGARKHKKSTSFDLSDSEEDSDGNLSDDPEGLISLTSPTLGSQTPGMMSSMTAATPKQFGLGKQATGVHTPGSVFSSMTTATFRGGQSVRTKVLKAQGLIERIPDELLYPKPFAYEDEEARIYVDTAVLARLGCFSGDWVEIAKAQDPALTGIASLGMSAFLDREAEEARDVRAVKVFGLPEILSNKAAPKYPVQGRARSSSITSFIGRPNTPSVYLSPVLLANIGDPTFLRLTPLRTSEDQMLGRPPAKMPPTSMPPAAKEANLLKVQSPVSIDKAVDSSVFNGLVSYFEGKQRLVKSGDLIAITVDEDVGRAVYDGGSAEDGSASDVLNFFGVSAEKVATRTGARNVVWFQVGNLTAQVNDDVEHPDVWNGMVSMVPSKTKMHQSGTEQRRIPPALSSTWPYYEGVLQLPKPVGGSNTGLTRTAEVPVSKLRLRLRELISTASSPRALRLGLPPMAILIHSTQRNIGKSYTAQQACVDLGLHCFAIDAFDILTEAAGGGGDNNTVGTFESRTERALQCGADNTCLLVEHIDALSSDRMYTAVKDKLDESRIVIATTTELDKVPENLRGLFTHELEMSAPDEAEREAILQSVITQSAVAISPAVDLGAIAVKTAALVAGDLVDVVDRAVAARQTRLENLAENADRTTLLPITVRDLEIAGGDTILSLVPADFDMAVDEARKNFADAIGAPKIPNVQWSDVGGLANVKDAVIETIQLPLSRPELFAKGLKKRSGILFYGPPGTGKTLLAKAIATEFSLNFFSVKGPELLNMYIGESEANVRRVFQRARDARPCVVFFDELDSVAPKRGNQGDSGGVMDRIVSQLLAELDGMSDGDSEDGGGGAGVFVIGATNRPDLLDQALLRPGRFDKMLYLGVSDTHDKQQKILEALTRKFILAPDLQLASVAASLPFTYTGADLYALCSDAMLKAVTRSASAVDDKIAKINAGREEARPPKPALTVAQFFDHHATDADLDVLVTDQDFRQANAELVPSVSAEELGHYERVRKEFEGGRDKGQAEPGSHAINGGTPGGLSISFTPQLPANPTPEEVEAWQAARIDEMMANGFRDGSLARNDPKGKGKGRIGSGFSSQLFNGADGSSLTTRDSRTSTRATDDDTEDSSDLVVRTGSMTLNGGSQSEHANGGTDRRHDSHRPPRERESRFFSSNNRGDKDKEKEKAKINKDKGRSSGKSRTMSLFSSKGKSRRQESVDHGDAGQTANGDKEVDGFGNGARDQGLYD